MYCRNCGTLLKEGSAHCHICGFSKDVGKKYCFSCGKLFEEFDSVDVCPICGTTIKERIIKEIPYKSKSKLAAGLLQSCLPFFALGRFYLGYYKIAVLQVITVVLTFGIGIIWSFIDGILILNGRLKYDANNVELKD